MGKHTYDQSPATLAYDEAKERWGGWVEGTWENGNPKLPFPFMHKIIETALVEQFEQHPIQAVHTVRSAFFSVSDQFRIEQNIEQQ